MRSAHGPLFVPVHTIMSAQNIATTYKMRTGIIAIE